MTMLYYGTRVVNVTASVLYPVYASYKALKPSPSSSRFAPGSIGSTTTSSGGSSESSSTAELERWTRYWCVMSFFWIYQEWLEWVLAWVPLYYELKMLLILWLVLPQFKGSNLAYSSQVGPFLSTHEASVDDFVSTVSKRVRSAGFNYLQHVVITVRQALIGGGLSTPIRDEPAATATATATEGGLNLTSLIATTTTWFVLAAVSPFGVTTTDETRHHAPPPPLATTSGQVRRGRRGTARDRREPADGTGRARRTTTQQDARVEVGAGESVVAGDRSAARAEGGDGRKLEQDKDDDDYDDDYVDDDDDHEDDDDTDDVEDSTFVESSPSSASSASSRGTNR